MSLPKISQYPTKTVVLPVSKKEVKYRPFLVKEEKILIMLKESESTTEEEMLNGMINVIRACTFDVVDPEKLPISDIEFLFLRIRAISKGEFSELTYRCSNKKEDGSVCNARTPVTLNLNEIDVTIPEGHKKSFAIPATNMTIHMKYPGVKLYREMTLIPKEKRNADKRFALMMKNCVEFVTDGDTVYSEFTEESLVDFLDSVPSSVFEEIDADFFNKFPALRHTHDFTCKSCGYQQKLNFEGFQSFF